LLMFMSRRVRISRYTCNKAPWQYEDGAIPPAYWKIATFNADHCRQCCRLQNL
jgi:hypothetical protein